MPIDYTKIITIEPDKRGGKPCIRGLRISVGDVLDWLASGMSEDEIIADFPELTHEDIKAALAIAADAGANGRAPSSQLRGDSDPYRATGKSLAGIDNRSTQAGRGDFVSDAELKAFFQRHGLRARRTG